MLMGFIFNCHVKTVALIICFKKFFVQVCNSRSCFQHSVVAGPLALRFKHATPVTKSEVSTGKVKYIYASILKGNEIKPLIIISIHYFHSNSHRTRSSINYKMEYKSKWSYPKQRFGYRVDRPKLKGGASKD